MANENYITIKEGIFAAVGVLSISTYKFLEWIMPKTYAIFMDGLKSKLTDFQKENQKELLDKIDELSHKVDAYKNEKHKIEGAYLEAQDAIKNNDLDKLKILRGIYNAK
jgi:uncharacterized protein YfbU (UPF0304 family)